MNALLLSLWALLVVPFGAVTDAVTTLPSPAVLGVTTTRRSPQLFPQASVAERDVPSSVRAYPMHPPAAPDRDEEAPRLALPDAHAAVVIDAASGTELYSQSAHARRPIASLTKLYTAYIVRTSGIALDAAVTVQADDLAGVGGSRVGCKSSTSCEGQRLVPGEVLTVRDLLTAMLIVSANDAAVVLARAIAGSEENFVALMNMRAIELGLPDSHFCTPNGLEEEGTTDCYSSAADIARIGALALGDSVIWELLSTERATITSIDGTVQHELVATNKFAGEAADRAPEGMIGAKTGFTPRAGESLILAARNPQNQRGTVVAVLLGDPQRWRDMRTLVDWTWDTYAWR